MSTTPKIITPGPQGIITPQIISGVINPLADSLYESVDLNDFFTNFTDKLVKTDSSLPYEDRVMLASSIKHYAKAITSQDERDLLINTKNKIAEIIPYKSRTFARPKAVLSAIQKVIANYTLGESPFIRDANGIRINLIGKESPEIQDNLYSVANKVITFLLSEGFSPYSCKPLKKVKLRPDIEGKILVPSESKILPIYQGFVEDRVYSPRDDGYQGIHVNFLSQNNVFIEVQFFTQGMRGYIEHYLDHKEYRLKKYGPPLEDYIYLPNVKLDGFLCLEGTIVDFVGLIKSIHI